MLSTDDLKDLIKAVDDKKGALFTLSSTCREMNLVLSETEYIKSTSSSIAEFVKTTIVSGRIKTNAYIKMWFAWYILDTDIIQFIFEDYYTTNPQARFLFGEAEQFIKDITDNTLCTSLAHEAKIYAFITQFIIQRIISPNFIPLLAQHDCPVSKVIDDLNISDDFKGKSTLLFILQILQPLFPTLELNFIITCSEPNIENGSDFFNDTLNTGIFLKMSDDEYASIVFQFFHAHYVQSIFGIVSNDNHMGNVLIQTLDTPITLDMSIGTAHIRFTTRYIVKFFDWDRAYYSMGTENLITNDFLMMRNVKKFIPGRDFSSFICSLYYYDIPGFNKILDRLIIGPKPTNNSNKNGCRIAKAVTPALLKWMLDNPTLIDIDNTDYKYITISKQHFEQCLPELINILRDKLSVDMNDVSIYENVTNVYLGVENNDVLIFKGHQCHPMYDSDALQVEQYFIDNNKFTNLCLGLNIICIGDLHTYTLVDPVAEAISVNNSIYAGILYTAICMEQFSNFKVDSR